MGIYINFDDSIIALAFHQPLLVQYHPWVFILYVYDHKIIRYKDTGDRCFSKIVPGRAELTAIKKWKASNPYCCRQEWLPYCSDGYSSQYSWQQGCLNIYTNKQAKSKGYPNSHKTIKTPSWMKNQTQLNSTIRPISDI